MLASSKTASANSAHVQSPSAATWYVPYGSADELARRLGQMPDVRRAAALVVDDGHLVPLPPEREHRQHEVLAPGREEPRGADDPAVADLALAFELRPPVDGLRAGRVRLDVRLALPPVEDVVGREVDDRRAERGDLARPLDVDAARSLLVRLSAVHVRERRRVEDEVGLRLDRRAPDLRQRAAELAARARDQDPTVSRCERIGDSVLQRCRTRGSFQGTPCSSGSAASYSSVTW